MEKAPYSIMRNFIVCSVHLIKSRRLRWASHVARMEECRSAFKNLTGALAGKRHLGMPRRRWEDNIRKYLNQLSAYDLISRHVLAVMHSGQ